jgi:hypothetical protein
MNARSAAASSNEFFSLEALKWRSRWRRAVRLRSLTPSDFDLVLLPLLFLAVAAASFARSMSSIPFHSVRRDAALVFSTSAASRLSPTEMVATCHASALRFLFSNDF